jgi:opacity protein-like surface antigen
MTKKLLCVVLASSLLLVTLAAGASSPPLASTLSRQQAQVLGRKGKLHLAQLGYRYHQEGRRIQSSQVSSYVRPHELFVRLSAA